MKVTELGEGGRPGPSRPPRVSYTVALALAYTRTLADFNERGAQWKSQPIKMADAIGGRRKHSALYALLGKERDR